MGMKGKQYPPQINRSRPSPDTANSAETLFIILHSNLSKRVGPGGQTPASRLAPAAVFTSANLLGQQRLQFVCNMQKEAKNAAPAGKGWFDQIHLGCHAHAESVSSPPLSPIVAGF